MWVLALSLVAVGGFGLVVVCTYAILRQPRPPKAMEDDTIAFHLDGPMDGQLVRVEGKVVVDAPVRAPSGAACAMYEIYCGTDDEPARALRRRVRPFQVDDGSQPIRIDPRIDLVAFDLPTAELEPDSDGQFIVERRLDAGARVQVVGRIRRVGAPGHEELTLEPADGSTGVALTFLA